MEHPALKKTKILLGATLALMVLLNGAATAQEREQPYFSLSSDTTFNKETPGIQVNTHRVSSLEFRVYKVNDPVEFFRNLEDPHQFGGIAPRLKREVTVIERFHRWKADARTGLRNLVRHQYSDESRATIRQKRIEQQEAEAAEGAKAKPRTTAQGTETYPAIPLLNEQQVVSTFSETFQTKRPWDSRRVSLPVTAKGLYLVEATNGDLRAYTIVSITGIAVISKTAPGRVLSFVVDRETGSPIPNCDLNLIADRKEIAHPKTDVNGINDAPIDGATPPDNVLVLARCGGEFAANAIFGWSLGTDPDRNFFGYVYSDRPVYRPGHTVYFKGILRNQSANGYRPIARREVDVEISDSEGNAVYRKALPVSSAGTVSGSFELPLTATLGYYDIQIRSGEGGTNGNFQVEEYKKPEYEVKVTTRTPRILQGETVTAKIDARYFYGEPVAFGKVKYVVHTSGYWFYSRDEDSEYDFGPEGSDGGEYGGDQVEEKTAQLDAEGQATITIPTTVSKSGRDQRYRIEARVTDQSNREIAGSGSVIATYGSFVVNVFAKDYVVKTGSTAAFSIEASDYDSKPIQTGFRIELRKAFYGQKRPEPIYVGSGRTDAKGKAAIDVPVSTGGPYDVTVIARTPEGRDVSASSYIWATGGVTAGTERLSRTGEMIEMVPDKKSYKPGDTAKVLITAAVPDAHMLVTTEGRVIASYQVTRLDGVSTTVSIPIKAESVPNVFVNAVFIKDGKQYEGSKSLKVPPTEQQILIEITPSKPQFKPGEPAVFAISTRDASGKPVSAEVSLGIVDEALYAVKPDNARDIVKAFYGTTYNHVNTSSSLQYYFNGSSGKRQMRLTTIRPPTALGQLKPERLVEARIRKAFPDTAFWNAALTTDANGRGEARMEFPDALTTWRATARAVASDTADTKVGSAVQRTLVRKNLVVRLAVPRFFTEGDRVTVSALVHNYLESEKKTSISLAVDGLDIIEGTTKEIQIPSKTDVRVDWTVRAGTQSLAKLTAKALTNEESDAMELTLPVLPFGVKQGIAQSGALGSGGPAIVSIAFPSSAAPSSRSIEVRVTPSIAGTVFGALGYLSTFPYGCTEQTMSSFLPNVIVMRALKELQVPSGIDEASVAKKTRDGLQRLYEFQHEDGGWGWWQTDDSAAFMTAYVVAGLVQARDAGVNVRPGAIERGVAWLGKEFDRSDRVVPEMRAYLLYALALGGVTDRAKIDSVWKDRARMETYGLAFLGLALDRTGDPRAGEIATFLESHAMSNDREAWWPGERDWMLEFGGDTGPETTAYVLKLLVKHRPASPLLAKAALWLTAHRSEGYYWSSTKQTAMVVYGMTDYLKASGELQGGSTVRVIVDGREVLSKSFTTADALALGSPSIRIPAAALASATHEIRIEKTGGGTVYWDARAEYASTDERLQKTGTVALNLLRDYFQLLPERKDGRIVHRLDPLDAKTGTLKPGDVIAVRLTVSGGPWRYLLTEDPIPAGTEFIAREDLYEIQSRPPWWQSHFTRREFHDDRAAFFQTSFEGQTQYFYLLKVVNPGEFRVSPARVQPMYQPQFLSATENRTVTVR